MQEREKWESVQEREKNSGSLIFVEIVESLSRVLVMETNVGLVRRNDMHSSGMLQ